MLDAPASQLRLAAAVLVEISAVVVVEFSPHCRRPKNFGANPARTGSGAKEDSGASIRQTTGAVGAQEPD